MGMEQGMMATLEKLDELLLTIKDRTPGAKIRE
jgi:hypothetical protein